MNRAEYMKELAYLLQDVPDGEKEEALQYYEDYFDDAGPENESQVIAELGRPEKIAAIIREGARNGYENQDAEYTEAGYRNERYRGPQYEVVPPEKCRKKRIGNRDIPDYDADEETKADADHDWADASYRSVHEGQAEYNGSTGSSAGEYSQKERGQTEYTQEKYAQERKPARRRFRPLLWILIAFVILFAAPLIMGGAMVVFAGILTVVCAVGGVALAVILVAAVLLVAGVFFIGVGIAKLFSFPIAGLMIGGAGLMILAIGVFFTWLSIILCGKAIPGIIHLIGNFFNFLSRRLRRGGAAA